MRSSLMTFPDDLAAEGVDQVVRTARDRAGVDGLTLAAVYHAARDLMPHRPGRRIVHTAAGAGGYVPDAARYGALTPPLAGPAATGRDLLAELRERCEDGQIELRAWAVFLHVDAPADGFRDEFERNAFGDPLAGQLCPARPAVRDYARALAGELAARGVGVLLAEALHHHGLEHGHHHERLTLPLSAGTRLLLGLCFCGHCRARGAAAGIDSERLRAWVRGAVDAALADPDEPDGAGAEPDREALAAACDGQLGAWLRMRAETVTTLAAEVAAAAAAGGARLALLDPAGSVKGYADGRPHGAPAAASGWRWGIDARALARAGVAVAPILYAADPERFALELDAYRALADGGTEQIVMRPSWPDCADVANLRAKLAAARAAGVERVDLYHYAFAPLSALDRIAAALP